MRFLLVTERESFDLSKRKRDRKSRWLLAIVCMHNQKKTISLVNRLFILASDLVGHNKGRNLCRNGEGVF